MIPDPNCHCEQCEWAREQERKAKEPKPAAMDVRYAAKLAAVYEELHDTIRRYADKLEWPACADPAVRAEQFKDFMLKRGDDEWAEYYYNLCVYIEHLIWTKPPKDKTKVDAA